MTSKQASGFSKEEAFINSGIDADFSKFGNATQMWKKEGSPMETKKLNKFMSEYMTKRKLVGAFIVVDGSKEDTRERSYTFINDVTDGKRKKKTVYQVIEAELDVKVQKETITDAETGEEKVVEKKVVKDVLAEGIVADICDTKKEAIEVAKSLTNETRKDYVIKIATEVVEGKPYAGYSVYTPSKSAKQGTFMFFSVE